MWQTTSTMQYLRKRLGHFYIHSFDTFRLKISVILSTLQPKKSGLQLKLLLQFAVTLRCISTAAMYVNMHNY